MLNFNESLIILQGWMCCQAYVTGERYNIHGIRNYLSKMEKYKIAFIPEGIYCLIYGLVSSSILKMLYY